MARGGLGESGARDIRSVQPAQRKHTAVEHYHVGEQHHRDGEWLGALHVLGVFLGPDSLCVGRKPALGPLIGKRTLNMKTLSYWPVLLTMTAVGLLTACSQRSEERRVGKECRS